MSVPDFPATALRQMGLDHRDLPFQNNGRAGTGTGYQITGAHVTQEILKAASRNRMNLTIAE